MKSMIPIEKVYQKINVIRNKKVMLSTHLAELYEVKVRVLVQAVKRNKERFPDDFMFQISKEEYKNLKSQIVTSSWGGARRARPYAFTEQVVAMLSSVLRSKRAIQVNIEIMRAFVQLNKMIISNKEFSKKLNELEKKYDKQFLIIFKTLHELMSPQTKNKKQIGFKPKKGGSVKNNMKEYET